MGNFNTIDSEINKFALSNELFLKVKKKVVSILRKKQKIEQKRQQKQVEKYFLNDSSIVVNSIHREEHEKDNDVNPIIIDKEKNNIILLYPWIKKPQDIVQIMPDIVSKLCLVWIRITPRYVSKYKLKISNILDHWTISDYIINTINRVKSDLYNNEEVDVTIVRNANTLDLINVAKNWWKNTTLIVWWHWNYNSALMTDWKVTNKEIEPVDEKLKAFIQHTCAWWIKENELWEWWASTIYWWDRNTSPIDFIEDPLPFRSES